MMTRTAFALLKSIGASETAFLVVGAEVEKAALAIMQKRLKAKDLTVDGLRDVCRAIGADTFAAVIDNLADKDVSSLIKKLDKLWPELKSASLPAQREHVLALAAGRVEPVIKLAPVPKAGKASGSKSKKTEPVASWSESMRARPPRG
ncbi:MAG: hypothetical protein WCC12_22015 [Anaerolineales bacterium]